MSKAREIKNQVGRWKSKAYKLQQICHSGGLHFTLSFPLDKQENSKNY